MTSVLVFIVALVVLLGAMFGIVQSARQYRREHPP